MTPLPPPHMRRPDVQAHDLLAASCCPEVHSFDRATASADRTGCPRPARGRGKGSAMKPFRVWGTRAAAVALLLVMATNALAIPSRPIDNDPQAPPIPTVFVGDPNDGGGRALRAPDSGLGIIQIFEDWIRLQLASESPVIVPIPRVQRTNPVLRGTRTSSLRRLR